MAIEDSGRRLQTTSARVVLQPLACHQSCWPTRHNQFWFGGEQHLHLALLGARNIPPCARASGLGLNGTLSAMGVLSPFFPDIAGVARMVLRVS